VDGTELDAWVRAGFRDAGEIFKPKEPDEWWPALAKNGQGRATTWAWAIILRAAQARCFGPRMMFSAPFHGPKHVPHRQQLLDKVWPSRKRLAHSPYEVMLDFSIHNWDAGRPVLLTAESEMYAEGGTGDSLEGEDDYSWDFYKLLLVASPVRLFIARVGERWITQTRLQRGTVRRNQLVKSLSNIVSWGGASTLQPGDELGVVILPEAPAEWRDLRVLWLDHGQLRQEKPWA
jgi:hypothetical protein